jgi:hypothetical protein
MALRPGRLLPLLQAVTARVDADQDPPSSIEGLEWRRLAGEEGAGGDARQRKNEHRCSQRTNQCYTRNGARHPAGQIVTRRNIAPGGAKFRRTRSVAE